MCILRIFASLSFSLSSSLSLTLSLPSPLSLPLSLSSYLSQRLAKCSENKLKRRVHWTLVNVAHIFSSIYENKFCFVHMIDEIANSEIADGSWNRKIIAEKTTFNSLFCREIIIQLAVWSQHKKVKKFCSKTNNRLQRFNFCYWIIPELCDMNSKWLNFIRRRLTSKVNAFNYPYKLLIICCGH